LIDGGALTIALSKMAKLFIQAARLAPSVICARCHPKQKSKITEYLQKFSKKRVACIGDGGNDVGMIQAANLGIGIMGKEGNQAALSSDFSIAEFK